MTENPGSRCQRGFALVLTLIFAILLYILVAELAVSGSMLKHTGENDALLTRMRIQADYALRDVEQGLLDDLAGQTQEAGGEAGGASGLAGALGGAGASSGAGGEGAGAAEGEADPSASCDSSRDTWYQPQAFPDGDITTYVWVEDENRKFNLLSLWSPDRDFAQFSRDRLVRLIDALREDTQFDIGLSDAERIVRDLEDWVKRQGSEAIPRPPLKTDDENIRDRTLPLHLDELLMLPSVKPELFYDQVHDGKVILGLESVLTLWTALRFDPGDPERIERQRARQAAQGGAAASGGDAGASGGRPAGASTAPDPNAPAQQPEGLGIRININTATRPVLRCLFPVERVSDQVIEAILRHRNTVDEEADSAEQAAAASDFGDLRLGEDVKLKFFGEVSELEQIEEFANLGDPQLKADFLRAVTTRSDVFTVHVASLFKRSEETRSFVLRRSRSVLVRRDDGETGKLYPLVLFEETQGLRLQPIDFQDEPRDLEGLYSEMDYFAQEERAWNPFLIEFYLPKEKRESFFQPGNR